MQKYSYYCEFPDDCYSRECRGKHILFTPNANKAFFLAPKLLQAHLVAHIIDGEIVKLLGVIDGFAEIPLTEELIGDIQQKILCAEICDGVLV